MKASDMRTKNSVLDNEDFLGGTKKKPILSEGLSLTLIRFVRGGLRLTLKIADYNHHLLPKIGILASALTDVGIVRNSPPFVKIYFEQSDIFVIILESLRGNNDPQILPAVYPRLRPVQRREYRPRLCCELVRGHDLVRPNWAEEQRDGV